MSTPVKQYYALQGKKIIEAFKKRNIEAYYCSTKEEASKQILQLIPKNSSVSWGGSMTLKALHIQQKLQEKSYDVLDRSLAKTPQEIEQLYHDALSCDYYLMSSNAITLDGKLVNTDGTGNRVAALIYGPKNVIIVAGMNKVVADENAALMRVKNQAAPINALRLNKNTPCTKTGKCGDCLSDDSICAHTVITRMSRIPNRIKVILVGESLGY
ncbi:MAG: lactate utilization protein [Epulopiscium sp.]|nr:lactate utilization protein [Candidatus Epulonipiscium sp.]